MKCRNKPGDAILWQQMDKYGPKQPQKQLGLELFLLDNIVPKSLFFVALHFYLHISILNIQFFFCFSPMAFNAILFIGPTDPLFFSTK